MRLKKSKLKDSQSLGQSDFGNLSKKKCKIAKKKIQL